MIFRMGSERLELPAELSRLQGLPRRVFEQWCKVRDAEGDIPLFDTFPLKAVSYADPYICVVGVEENPRRYRMLRAGAELISHYGRDFTGMCLDEMSDLRNVDAIIQLDDDIVATREPIAALVTVGILGIPVIRLNGIGIPFRAADGRISHLISCTTRELFGFGV